MAFSRACLSIYAATTGYFCSDFAKIYDFYIGNAVQFSIRSDPFFEVFLRYSLSKVDMHAY